MPSLACPPPVLRPTALCSTVTVDRDRHTTYYYDITTTLTTTTNNNKNVHIIIILRYIFVYTGSQIRKVYTTKITSGTS